MVCASASRWSGTGRRLSLALAAALTAVTVGTAGCSGEQPSSAASEAARTGASAPEPSAVPMSGAVLDEEAAPGSPQAGTETADTTVEAPTADQAAATEEAPAADQAAATPVPPPSGSGDLSVVQVEPQTTLEPVAATASAEAAEDLTVQIALGEADVTARRPGEIGGRALTVSVRMTNEGTSPRDVSTVSVSVDDAEDIPLSSLHGEPYSPFEGELKAGGSTEGVYVFTLGEADDPFTVSVNAGAEEPVVVFVGSLENTGRR